MKKQTIKFSDIKATVKTQARVELNKEAVADYTARAKEAKAKGADFPFDGGTVFKDPAGNLWLGDGFHRRVAGKSAGYEGAEYAVLEGTENDAFLFGCKKNNDHGVRLTHADKAHNLSRVVEIPGNENLSDVALGEIAGVSTTFARMHRPVTKAPTERISKTGKKIKTARIGTKKGKAPKPVKPKKEKKAKPGAEKKAPAEPAAKFNDETMKAIRRITTVIGGDAGPALRKAIEDGSLNCSAAELRLWAETSEGRIQKIAALVVEKGFTVGKAIAFIDKIADANTKAEHFINRAVAGNGIDFTEKVDGHVFCVFDSNVFKLEHDKTSGTVTITPKASK